MCIHFSLLASHLVAYHIYCCSIYKHGHCNYECMKNYKTLCSYTNWSQQVASQFMYFFRSEKEKNSVCLHRSILLGYPLVSNGKTTIVIIRAVGSVHKTPASALNCFQLHRPDTHHDPGCGLKAYNAETLLKWSRSTSHHKALDKRPLLEIPRLILRLFRGKSDIHISKLTLRVSSGE